MMTRFLYQNRNAATVFRGVAAVACLFLTACATTEEPSGSAWRRSPQPQGAPDDSEPYTMNYAYKGLPERNYYGVPGQSAPQPYMALGKWYQPLAHADGFIQRGIASWYGEDFHGKPTSSKEIYDMDGISAAHKILPLHTWVRVTNLENGKNLVLRINDRGPFVPGRIIDLSRGAARELGVYGPGTGQVEIVALGVAPPPPGSVRMASSVTKPPPMENLMAKSSVPAKMAPVDFAGSRFQIQVGAFGQKDVAEKLATRLREAHSHAAVSPIPHPAGKSTLYRVLVGRYASLEEASRYEERLRSQGFSGAFTIAE